MIAATSSAASAADSGVSGNRCTSSSPASARRLVITTMLALPAGSSGRT
jgi:hypothetical protein